MSSEQHPARSSLPRRQRPVWPLVAVVLACALPEIVLGLADRGLIGQTYLRSLAYALWSFRPELLTGALPIFPVQPLTMFMTYAFVHTGLVHLAGNMAGFWWLGRIVLRKRRVDEFLALYLLSGVGAGVAFAALGPGDATMVGASGALFGLLGALSAENRVGRLRRLSAPLRVLVVALVLVGLDQAGRLVLGSPVAWQAHLGGFMTGAAFALFWPLKRA